MRVVDRKSFLALPAGTFYCEGEKWNFGNIRIKDDSLENDWFFLDMAWPDSHDLGEAVEQLELSLATGGSFPCETATTRDGCFHDEALFLIFEPADLWALRGRVDVAITAAGQGVGK